MAHGLSAGRVQGLYVQGMNTFNTNPTSDSTPATPFLFASPCDAQTPMNELPGRLGLAAFAVVVENVRHPAVFTQLRAALRMGRTRASLIADTLPIARSCMSPLSAQADASHPVRDPRSTPPLHTPAPSPAPSGPRVSARATYSKPSGVPSPKGRPARDPQRQFRFPTRAA